MPLLAPLSDLEFDDQLEVPVLVDRDDVAAGA